MDITHSKKLQQARDRLLGQLSAWVEGSGLSQRDAARLLGVHQPIVIILLRDPEGRGISLVTLLEMWERIGGEFTLTIKAPKGF
jgi:predicted XRE-type DNA-binding protein